MTLKYTYITCKPHMKEKEWDEIVDSNMAARTTRTFFGIDFSFW